MADFQEYYGINLLAYRAALDGDKTTDEVLWLAILAAQLPTHSRTNRAASPALAWSDETYMLARCDYALRTIAWMFSEDGSKGINRPEPITTPAEIAERAKVLDGVEAFDPNGDFLASIAPRETPQEVTDGE